MTVTGLILIFVTLGNAVVAVINAKITIRNHRVARQNYAVAQELQDIIHVTTRRTEQRDRLTELESQDPIKSSDR